MRLGMVKREAYLVKRRKGHGSGHRYFRDARFALRDTKNGTPSGVTYFHGGP
jgi:hypothetical protein